MKATVVSSDMTKPVYNRKSTDQADATRPKRDAQISGSRGYSAAAQSSRVHEHNVVSNIEQANAESIAQRKAREEIIKQVHARLTESARIAVDLRNSDEARRAAGIKFMQEIADSKLTIRFVKDYELNRIVVQMIERGTGEVINTFPPERQLELEKLAKMFPGMFLNTEV